MTLMTPRPTVQKAWRFSPIGASLLLVTKKEKPPYKRRLYGKSSDYNQTNELFFLTEHQTLAWYVVIEKTGG